MKVKTNVRAGKNSSSYGKKSEDSSSHKSSHQPYTPPAPVSRCVGY